MTATTRNGIEFPQKIKGRTTTSIYPKDRKWLSWRDICTPMFTAALFQIAKICKQPKCLQSNEWIRKMLQYTHTEILFTYKNKKILAFSTWDEPGEHYDKWNKPDREIQILHDITFIWNKIKKSYS